MKRQISPLYSYDDSQCLGQGAYSKVYIGTCQDPHLIAENMDGQVAIKHISRRGMKPRLQQRLLQELEIMELIRLHPHPNVVRCYGTVDTQHDDVYIIMEYCESNDLSYLMKKPIKEKYVQFYLCQLNQGLQHLEMLNVIHRDIKPKNILLTRNRKILKIADFGFAKMVAEEQSVSQTLCGSPLYMAPEIMRKEVSTTKTDLWSIGMMMYEMLFGFHPFKDIENIFDLMYAVESREIVIPPPDNPNQKLTPGCVSLLGGLLRKDPVKRLGWTNFYSHPWANRYIIEHEETYRVKHTSTQRDPQDSLVDLVNDSLLPSAQRKKSTTKIQLIEEYVPTQSSSLPPIIKPVSEPIPIPKPNLPPDPNQPTARWFT